STRRGSCRRLLNGLHDSLEVKIEGEKAPPESPSPRVPLIIYTSVVDNQSMKPIDLVQGTLDLLILKSLVLEPQHGWAIAARIRQLSNDVLLVQQGSLYP